MDKYKISYTELEDAYKDNKSNQDLKKKVEFIKTSYPQIISDAEPTN